MILMKKTVFNYLRVIREKVVILDKDLALLLGCDPRTIKDKIRKQLLGFPEDYLFKLTHEEASTLLQIVPLGASKARETPLLGARKHPARGKENDGRYLPYALTLCGIQYLSSKTKDLETKNRYEAIVEAFNSFQKTESKPVNLSVKDGGSISSVIYQIRNQFVILDEDLATYYHSTVKRVNEQVKRNPLKFPKGFMFQLSQEEHFAILKSQNATSRWGGKRKLPYVFTEAGVYMLMTVLDSEIAAKQSVALILAFKEMKDRLYRNQYPLISVHEFDELKTKVWENDQTLTLLNKEVEGIKERLDDPNAIKYFIIHNGERVLADEIFQKIYSRAKASVCIIDDYIGLRTLEHLRFCPHGIHITFISDNAAQPKLTQPQVNDFQKDRPDLKLIFLRSKRLVHDRLIAIDTEGDFVLYHCGGSSKDAGEKITFIQELPIPEIYKEVIERLLENEPLQMD